MRRNVTFSVPESVLRRFRIYAAEQNQSMTSLVAQAMVRMMEQGGKREKAAERLIERMKKSPDRGLRGRIPWTRDEIHER